MARNTVRVNMPDRGVTPPPPPAEEQDDFDLGTLEERRAAIPNPFGNFLQNLRQTILGGAPGAFAPGGPGVSSPDTLRRMTPRQLAPNAEEEIAEIEEELPLIPGPIVPGDPRWSYERMMAGRGTPVNPQGETFTDMLANYQFDGSPYDRAGDYLAERREAQMRAIQDMYNEYAAETQANVDRIGDIYGGAEAGIGETYAGATGNIEDAYASAQQQAADQMARLGIEEAAPAVLDPMALSQAETLSNLETGRASSLGATQQFGATAGGFATDMATIAQQQALENQRSLTDQLADQLFEIEMQRAQAEAAYDPYSRMLGELEAQQAFNQLYNPAPDTEAAQRAAELQLETTLSRQDKLLQLWSEIRSDYNTDEEAMAAAEAAMQQAEATFPIR